MPGFSIREIPFSYGGSWFNFSPVTAENTYADDVHLVSHQTRLHPVLRLTPRLSGVRVDTTVTAVPSRLTWTQGEGRVELAFESPDTVRARGRGLGLRIAAADPVLTPFSGPYFLQDPVDGAYVFTLYETGRRYRVTVLSGAATATGTQQLGATERAVDLDDEAWEVAIEEYDSAREPYRAMGGFEEVAARAATEFEGYLEAIAPWRTEETPAAALAAYVLWSATVHPAGYLGRPAVLMSKHWMDKVWSWDHCFNALALADGLPTLAWDQFQLPFDHQDAAGALPDSIAHSEILHNFVKPPIHGWTLRQLRRRIPDLEETYHRLVRWTDFWLTTRRVPGHPLAHYQHGNDSGWDNATTFDPARVVESPDLAAFLVLQLRELTELAKELGHTTEAERWRSEASRMRTGLLELWTGEEFAARAAGTDKTWPSTSLLNLMPIVLAEELPDEIRQKVARSIRRHLTAHGLATERPDSPHYEPDGYWRGPIWAPATVLIEDGLRRSGFTTLADDISNRFRTLCEQNGFAENFDAHTGTGQRDRAYTWTASAYLILATAHERRRSGVNSKIRRPRPPSL